MEAWSGWDVVVRPPRCVRDDDDGHHHHHGGRGSAALAMVHTVTNENRRRWFPRIHRLGTLSVSWSDILATASTSAAAIGSSSVSGLVGKRGALGGTMSSPPYVLMNRDMLHLVRRVYQHVQESSTPTNTVNKQHQKPEVIVLDGCHRSLVTLLETEVGVKCVTCPLEWQSVFEDEAASSSSSSTEGNGVLWVNPASLKAAITPRTRLIILGCHVGLDCGIPWMNGKRSRHWQELIRMMGVIGVPVIVELNGGGSADSDGTGSLAEVFAWNSNAKTPSTRNTTRTRREEEEGRRNSTSNDAELSQAMRDQQKQRYHHTVEDGATVKQQSSSLCIIPVLSLSTHCTPILGRNQRAVLALSPVDIPQRSFSTGVHSSNSAAAANAAGLIEEVKSFLSFVASLFVQDPRSQGLLFVLVSTGMFLLELFNGPAGPGAPSMRRRYLQMTRALGSPYRTAIPPSSSLPMSSRNPPRAGSTSCEVPTRFVAALMDAKVGLSSLQTHHHQAVVVTRQLWLRCAWDVVRLLPPYVEVLSAGSPDSPQRANLDNGLVLLVRNPGAVCRVLEDHGFEATLVFASIDDVAPPPATTTTTSAKKQYVSVKQKILEMHAIRVAMHPYMSLSCRRELLITLWTRVLASDVASPFFRGVAKPKLVTPLSSTEQKNSKDAKKDKKLVSPYATRDVLAFVRDDRNVSAAAAPIRSGELTRSASTESHAPLLFAILGPAGIFGSRL